MTVEAQPVMERVSARLPGMPRGLGRFIRRQPLGAAGALIIIAMALAAILAGPISPYDPLEVNYGAMFHRPGNEHWLGTDAYGRDVFSRIIYGSRTALLIGLSASFVGATMGALIGVISAYYGGTTDLAVQRIVDILISFPIIILAMAIVAITGTGLFKLIVAISLSMVPRCALVVRSSALAVRHMIYVEAARAMGAPHRRIILRHMFPNVTAPYLIMLTAFLGQAILLEASLSFLGLGVSEPTPAWGLMLRGAAVEFAERAPWMAVFPGLAISLAVFAFNLFGDALRDALDPRLRT